jgi:hypothetical protein
MRRNGKPSRLERLIAAGLSAVWLSAGCAALYIALTNSRWLIAALALLAVGYGAAWLRVAFRARPLVWHELVAPWRSVDGARAFGDAHAARRERRMP